MSARFADRPTWISGMALALAAALLLGVVLPLHRQNTKPTRVSLEEHPWLLPPTGVFRVASLGYRNVAADILWLATIQYFGTHLQSDGRYPELRRLLDTVVALDPHFVEAYTLGGLILMYFARDVQAGIDLLERGAQNNPDRWEIPYDLARTYYLDLKDYPKALHWFEVADKLPGRPTHVPRFIARLYAATGERETALELWRAVAESATNEWIRQLAAREIAKLEAANREPHPGAR